MAVHLLAIFANEVRDGHVATMTFPGDHSGIEGVGSLPFRFGSLPNGPTASMDVAGVDLLKIRDGKIVEVRLFPSDGSAEDAFWDMPDCGAAAGAPLGELEDLVAWSLVEPSVDSAGRPVFRPRLPPPGVAWSG